MPLFPNGVSKCLAHEQSAATITRRYGLSDILLLQLLDVRKPTKSPRYELAGN